MMNKFYFVLLLIVTAISSSACNKKIKEKLGIVTTGPNEYRVIRNKGLEMPPHYDLPLPVAQQTSKASNVNNNSSDLNSGAKALIKEIEKNH